VKAAADALDERVAQAAGDLIDVTLKQAGDGNLAAVKMLLDRIWPAGRGRPLEIGASEINRPHDLLSAVSKITKAVLEGDATAEEAVATAKVIKVHLAAIHESIMEDRLAEIEQEVARYQKTVARQK
jgi:hypothetical protein